MFDKKPNVEDILSLWRGTEKYYNKMMADFRVKWDFAHGNFLVKVPTEVKDYVYKTPKPYTKVHKGAVQLVTEYPRFNIPQGYGATEKDSKKHDLMMKFGDRFFKESEIHNSIPPMRSAAVDILTYGATSLEIHWLKDEYKAGKWPYRLRIVNAETVYPLPDGSYFKMYRRRVIDVMEHIEKLNFGKPNNFVEWTPLGRSGYKRYEDDAEVEWLEFYDVVGKWKAIFVESDPVFVNEVLPDGNVTKLVHKFSGWAGSTPDGKPEFQAVGINDANFDMYKYESQLMTIVASGVAKNVLGTRIISESAADRVKFPEYVGDDLIEPFPNAVRNEPAPQVNQDAYQLIQWIRSDEDETTFKPSLQGTNQANVQSGTHAAVLTGQDMKTFRPIRKQLELMVQELVIAAFYMLIEHATDGIKLNNKDTIRPSSVMLPIPLIVDLEPQDPEREEAKNMALLKFWAQGAIPWEVFAQKSNLLADIGIESARRSMLVERALNDPQVQQIMAQKALQEWALAEQQEAAQMAQQELGQPQQQEEVFGTRDGRAMTEASGILNQTAQGAGANIEQELGNDGGIPL